MRSFPSNNKQRHPRPLTQIREGIRHLLLQTFHKEKTFRTAVVYYLIGMAVFLLFAEFQWRVLSPWNKNYYLWDKGKDIIFWWALYLYVPKNYKVVAFLLCIF